IRFSFHLQAYPHFILFEQSQRCGGNSMCYTAVLIDLPSHARYTISPAWSTTTMKYFDPPMKPIQPDERLYGGFIPGLPPELESLRQQLVEMQRNGSPYETAVARRELVLQTLAHVQDDPDCTPETRATLQCILAVAYQQHPGGDRAGQMKAALVACTEALQVYTLTSHPYLYASVQVTLGHIYRERTVGAQRDDLERAIACYHEALRVYTLSALPYEYAQAQDGLGQTYQLRIEGERQNNLEQAITSCGEALGVRTLEAFPFEHAQSLHTLGAAYTRRVAGDRRDNQEQAIACGREGLRVYTLNLFPFRYAMLQNNLGAVYLIRVAGERRDNLEQTIVCYREAMRVWTLEALPQDYAMVQRNLGATYQIRLAGERQENLYLALAAHQESLRIYTLDAFPIEHRQVQLDCAETQALREDWEGAHSAYVAARKAEDLLVALGAGAVGRDAVLKEGRAAAIHDGFALTRLGKIEEAAVAIERGRARGLAEAIQFNSADPERISNPERRIRYRTTRQAFIAAQALLQASHPTTLDEDSQRHVMLERTAAYRDARAAFAAVIEEIRLAQDPTDFLRDTLDAAMILQATEGCGPGHALVYLAATPWGGIAVAAFSAQPARSISAGFAALALPALTEELVRTLIETRLADSEYTTGGFDCAQRGNVFELLQAWPGTTFRERAGALHAACVAREHPCTIDAAAQFVLALPELAPFVDHPLTNLSEERTSLLASTLNHAVLQRELQRCQSALNRTMLQPLLVWLHEAGVCSLTLVPCGRLAALPLTGTLLPDGHTLGEKLPTSIAPSALSLLPDEQSIAPRTGIYALGNPYPTQQNLRWGEAEAFTLAELGQRLARSAGVRVQWQATRNWLIEALHTGLVVNASCHGIFDTRNFLRSRLILAREEELTLADLLSDQVDLRGLRLLILSACQTAILDLQGARDEVRSLAAGMLQAGAAAILASLWSVDDRATYLLMVRFALEWFPQMHNEPPATALARAQRWLRTVTNRELLLWQANLSPLPVSTNDLARGSETFAGEHVAVHTGQLVAVRGRANRFDAAQAQEVVQSYAEELAPGDCPYADPYYWAGFQITGW